MIVEDMLRHRLETLTKQSAQYAGLQRDAARQLPRDLHRRGRLRPADAARRRRSSSASCVDKLASGRLGGIEVWRRMHELRDSGHDGVEIQHKLAEEFPGVMDWEP